MTTAYEVRSMLRKSAEQNKRYYDIRVKPNIYSIGEWVYYFNPRKFVRRQDKWNRKYSGPFLVVKVPSPVNVVIQRNAKAKPFPVHIDKVKPFPLTPPKSWLPEVASESNEPPREVEANEQMGYEDSFWEDEARLEAESQAVDTPPPGARKESVSSRNEDVEPVRNEVVDGSRPTASKAEPSFDLEGRMPMQSVAYHPR